jgi:hypothetical protein
MLVAWGLKLAAYIFKACSLKLVAWSFLHGTWDMGHNAMRQFVAAYG